MSLIGQLIYQLGSTIVFHKQSLMWSDYGFHGPVDHVFITSYVPIQINIAKFLMIVGKPQLLFFLTPM